MDIADIKRWQWIVIGLIAGLALGWVWSGLDNDPDGRKISQNDFERDLMRKHPETNEPLIRNIKLHTPTADYANKLVQVVTFDRLMQGAKSGTTLYKPQQIIATIPYRPTFMRPAGDASKYTVEDYLTEMAKRNDAVTFSKSWMGNRPLMIAAWTLGTMVVVGGIWPTLLNLMIGAGLGGHREKKAKEGYFDRFSHAPEAAKAPVAVGVSDADRRELDDMNREMEERLAAGAVDDPITDETATPAPVEIRKMEGGPLERTAVPRSPDDDDEVEVKGEFYPVLIHHKKHHEEDEKGKKANDP